MACTQKIVVDDGAGQEPWRSPWGPDQLDRNKYVRFRTLYTFDRFVDIPRDGAYRILDYGSGYGHSVEPLLDEFPNARFVCVEYDEVPLAAFMSRFGAHPRVRGLGMKGHDVFQLLEAGFDIIQMNAVFEHLLPSERREIMPKLWQKLAVGGHLVLTETPWRWFPVETHTTSMPLINYLPKRLALSVVRHCGRYPKDISWHDSLKNGVRGATVREIVASLGARPDAVQVVRSQAPDACDMLEIWWHGESRDSRQKAFAYRVLRALRTTTGIVISPWVNVVLKKLA